MDMRFYWVQDRINRNSSTCSGNLARQIVVTIIQNITPQPITDTCVPTICIVLSYMDMLLRGCVYPWDIHVWEYRRQRSKVTRKANAEERMKPLTTHAHLT